MPLRIKIKDRKISILNYSEREFNIASEHGAGANPYDTIKAYYDIQKEKQENDFVIVIYHGGLEYQFYPTPEMVTNFKFMVDAGADTVVAHHSHRYSGTLIYKDKPLIFGLGNFFCSTKNIITEEWLTGLLLRLKLNTSSIAFDLLPVIMSDALDKVGLLEGNAAEKIMKKVGELSSTINDELLLMDYWMKKDRSDKKRIMRLLKARSRFEYRLRKYFPDFFWEKISGYKRKIWLNNVRCDSHRNRLIRILEDH
jgi:poly-gamma-glutamate synthesis protein (capsule biosynthesis protein)